MRNDSNDISYNYLCNYSYTGYHTSNDCVDTDL